MDLQTRPLWAHLGPSPDWFVLSSGVVAPAFRWIIEAGKEMMNVCEAGQRDGVSNPARLPAVNI